MRSPEPNWYDAQDRGLEQLREAQAIFDCPVLIAGDIFDKWTCPPQLINFALEALPSDCYVIPGQHDLPNHDYDDMHRAAIQALISAGLVTELKPDKPIRDRGLNLYGFPWNAELHDLSHFPELYSGLNVAIVHRYIWKRGKGHAAAAMDSFAKNVSKELTSYDVAIFGDNHIPFTSGNCYNCGSFFRRKADERDHKPSIGLLKDTGMIERCYLDVEEDKFLDAEDAMELVESIIDMSDFVESLAQLKSDSLDFVETVVRFLERNEIAQTVRRKVMEALNDGPS